MPKRQSRNNPQPNKSDRQGIAGRVQDVHLLSFQKCRSLLPLGCNISDEDVEALGDSLYCLAAVVIDGFTGRSREAKGTQPSRQQANRASSQNFAAKRR